VAKLVISTPLGLCDPLLDILAACTLTVRPGEQVTLGVLALDAAGRIIVGVTPQWASDQPGVAEAVSLGQGALVTSGVETGTTRVTASVGSATSPAVSVVNLGPAGAGVRVTVVDGRTGAPVRSAVVRVNQESATTPASGAVTWEAGVEAPFTVSVFHASFDYVTLALLPAEAGGGLDAVVALEPVMPPEASGGLRGTVNLDAATSTGPVSLSLSGVSNPTVSGMSFSRLLGETFFVDISVPMLGSQRVPLPGGITLGAELPLLGPQVFKDAFYVLGEGGRRIAWTFGGRLPLMALVGLVGIGDPVTAILSLVPFFEGLTHGLATGYVLADLPYVVDGDTDYDGVADVNNNGVTGEWVPDYFAFPQAPLTVRQAQTLYTSVQFREFPPDASAPDALVVAGARVPGHGFIPLGMTSVAPPEAEAGYVPMKMAPRYGGLEVGDYTVAAFAFGATAGSTPSQLSLRVVSAETLPQEVDLGVMMPFPTGSSYRLLASPPSRLLTVRSVAGAHLMRVTLAGQDGQWMVYVPVAPGAQAVALPDVPLGMAERGRTGRAVEAIQVSVALRVQGAGEQVRALVGLDGQGLPRLAHETEGLSRSPLEAP
jgi:hypothetical protein